MNDVTALQQSEKRFASRYSIMLMRYVARIIPGLLLMVLAGSLQALPVEGLYEEDIAVSDQSEAERRRGYQEALSRVILKVSGKRRWLEHPQVRSALANAADYVSEVSYTSTGLDGYLSVNFDRELVDGMLARADIPVWDNNRASVLLWITIQRADGRRETLGSGSDHELLEQAKKFSTERAVPVLIPIMDLVDRRLVTPDQAWSLDTEALRAVGERYGADSVLAVRLLEIPGGETVSMWQFIFRDQVDVFDHVDTGDEDYMEFPLDRATNTLVDYYGLLPADLDREDAVALKIDGITDLVNHMALLRYLDSLSLVRQVEMTKVRPDGVDVILSLSGSRRQLTDTLSLSRDLRPQGGAEMAMPGTTLHYIWDR